MELSNAFTTLLWTILGSEKTAIANGRIHTAVIKWRQLATRGETNVAGSHMALRAGRNVLQFGT
jgi:hypothetical protein